MIDEKIKVLRSLTNNFPFIEYYSHTSCDMYKILNEHTRYNEHKFVLCPVEDGFEKALECAIAIITEEKKKYYETCNL